MNHLSIIKYPRTRHIEGSALQPGDHDLKQVPIEALRDKHVVIEEKVDGANAGLSFDQSGRIQLQSRGHYLVGGKREKHFDLFKHWAATHQEALRQVLGARFLLFGEWLYAKHTVFYDALPHYFLEFDVFDRETATYLGTPERHGLLEGTPVSSVRVITSGKVESTQQLRDNIGTSAFITPEAGTKLERSAQKMELDPDLVRRETDPSGLMEGLYLKVEADGLVQERYKFVRADFLTTVVESETHWLDRPIIPNQLCPDVDLFAQPTP